MNQFFFISNMGNTQEREGVSALEIIGGVGITIAAVCTGGLALGVVGMVWESLAEFLTPKQMMKTIG